MGSGQVDVNSEEPRRRRRGFKLTKTDYAVIVKIAELGIQNYRQLREGVLKDRHRVAVWARMKRLFRAGYVRECRDDNGRILAWTISRKGANRVYVDPVTAKGEAKRAPIYRSAFEHDLILVDVRALLSQSPVITNWESETALRESVMRQFHYLHPVDRREKIVAVPDAILHLEAKGARAKAALELELTQKSRGRLFKKFEAHITSAEFDYVLYIVKDEALKARLMELYRHVNSHSVRVKIARERNGIYFTTLSNLLKEGLTTKFESLRDTLSFAELAV